MTAFADEGPRTPRRSLSLASLSMSRTSSEVDIGGRGGKVNLGGKNVNTSGVGRGGGVLDAALRAMSSEGSGGGEGRDGGEARAKSGAWGRAIGGAVVIAGAVVAAAVLINRRRG